MEYYRAGYLDFSQQVEVSENEEELALLFILLPHVCLENLYFIGLVMTICQLLLIRVVDEVSPVLSISERENVISHLNHEHWKVEFSQLKVDILQGRHPLLLLSSVLSSISTTLLLEWLLELAFIFCLHLL